jgi:hypothetical protein
MSIKTPQYARTNAATATPQALAAFLPACHTGVLPLKQDCTRALVANGGLADFMPQTRIMACGLLYMPSSVLQLRNIDPYCS